LGFLRAMDYDARVSVDLNNDGQTALIDMDRPHCAPFFAHAALSLMKVSRSLRR